MDPDREIRCSDRARPKTDRWSTGQLAMGLRHEGCGALVSGGHHSDPDALERVEKTQK
jgi:hypothetical protein